MPMQLRLESQLNPVADPVAAITAVTRPILAGLLFGLKGDVAGQLGGHESVTLSMLARVYRPGDGDCGLCFEYAVHDAMNRSESWVIDRAFDALSRHCNLPGQQAASILFGAEKEGALNLIDTAADRLTDESILLSGSRGRPVKLKRHIKSVAAAFRRPQARERLPQSISGLWKADLFLGFTDEDRWVGTTVKINPRHLEPARGLRVAIIPAQQGTTDRIRKDDEQNLVICPLPYDGAFMETFYRGWEVVQSFITADARVPRDVNLPMPDQRQVARYLSDRRDYAVVAVIEALEPLAQPHLLETSTRNAELAAQRDAQTEVGAAIAPTARVLK
jgi:hypothetical protein